MGIKRYDKSFRECAVKLSYEPSSVLQQSRQVKYAFMESHRYSVVKMSSRLGISVRSYYDYRNDI